MNEPVLMYHFEGLKFEFMRDEIIITDDFYSRKWKMKFLHEPDNPFQIELIEKDYDWSNQGSEK